MYSKRKRETCHSWPVPSAYIQAANTKTLRGDGLRLSVQRQPFCYLYPNPHPSLLSCPASYPAATRDHLSLGFLSKSDWIGGHDQRQTGLYLEVWSADIHLHSESLWLQSWESPIVQQKSKASFLLLQIECGFMYSGIIYSRGRTILRSLLTATKALGPLTLSLHPYPLSRSSLDMWYPLLRISSEDKSCPGDRRGNPDTPQLASKCVICHLCKVLFNAVCVDSSWMS